MKPWRSRVMVTVWPFIGGTMSGGEFLKFRHSAPPSSFSPFGLTLVTVRVTSWSVVGETATVLPSWHEGPARCRPRTDVRGLRGPTEADRLRVGQGDALGADHGVGEGLRPCLGGPPLVDLGLEDQPDREIVLAALERVALPVGAVAAVGGDGVGGAGVGLAGDAVLVLADLADGAE